MTLAIAGRGNNACQAQQQLNSNNRNGSSISTAPQTQSESKATRSNGAAHPDQPQNCWTAEGSDAAEQPPQHWRTREWVSFIANLALAIFGLLGIVVGVGSVIAVWRQGNHITSSERAWIIAKMDRPIIPHGNLFGYTGIPRLVNEGKTPAFIFEIGNAAVFLPKDEDLPETPPDIEEGAIFSYGGRGIPISPSDHFGRIVISPKEPTLRVLNGDVILWLYGYVRYRDVFSNRQHRTRYCFRLAITVLHHRPDFTFVIDGPAAYNEAT